MEEEGFLGSSAPIAPGNSGRSIISCWKLWSYWYYSND
jgi:hypothetical protein